MRRATSSGNTVRLSFLPLTCQTQRAAISLSTACSTLASRSLATSSDSTSTERPRIDPAVYCRDAVRRSDYGHYLLGLFLPQSAREGYLAIRAFNLETSKIKDTTSEVVTGMIRIKWWEEAIEECYKGTPRRHPVVEELAKAITNHNLSRTWFKRVLTKRAEDLETRVPRTMDDLETYADHTASSLIGLSLETLGVKDVNADHAASHIGRAVGIVTVLRGTPYVVQRKQLYLPYEILARHKVSQEDLFRGVTPPKLSDVAYDIASVAHLHLEKARELKSSIPKAAYPALMASYFAEDYLERLRKRRFNIFDPTLSVVGDFSYQWNLWKGYYFKRY